VSTGQPGAGYRPLVLPGGLEELERSGPSSSDGTCTLVAADSDTLVWRQDLESGEPAVFKMYRHRGRVSWWRENHSRFRVQREFSALTYLEQRGIPTSAPLFWSFGRCAGYGRYEMLATREIPGTVPLNDVVARDRPEPSRLGELYRIVRMMHDHGFHHGSLMPRNVLVTQDGSRVWAFHIIDTPKSIVFPYAVAGRRPAWIDLLDLSLELFNELGMESCAPLLADYGFDQDTVERFLARLQRYIPTRHTRNLHRAECQARELLAKLRSR